MNLRIAENCDGKAIGELAAACGFGVANIDWSEVHPYWLVAERDGRMVGAIQVLPGRPIGRIEMLCTADGLRRRDRAAVVMSLLYQACAVLRLGGSRLASGALPRNLSSYRAVIEKRGAWIADECYLMMVRL